jgi:hypothetical protein
MPLPPRTHTCAASTARAHRQRSAVRCLYTLALLHALAHAYAAAAEFALTRTGQGGRGGEDPCRWNGPWPASRARRRSNASVLRRGCARRAFFFAAPTSSMAGVPVCHPTPTKRKRRIMPGRRAQCIARLELSPGHDTFALARVWPVLCGAHCGAVRCARICFPFFFFVYPLCRLATQAHSTPDE